MYLTRHIRGQLQLVLLLECLRISEEHDVSLHPLPTPSSGERISRKSKKRKAIYVDDRDATPKKKRKSSDGSKSIAADSKDLVRQQYIEAVEELMDHVCIWHSGISLFDVEEEVGLLQTFVEPIIVST